MHSHRGLAGAMRDGHAASALGGLASFAGTSLRPRQSLCASLPVPVVEGPAVGRPGIRSIWVRRVTRFFPGDFPPPCATDAARLEQDPAHVYVRGVPAARLDRNRFGLGVGMEAV